MGQIYQGEIDDVLSAGEYDQGDRVLIYYDDLYDLVHPRKQEECKKELCPCCNFPECGHNHDLEAEAKKESEENLSQATRLAASTTAWTLLVLILATLANLGLGDLARYRWPWYNVVILALVSGIGYYQAKKNS